MNFRERCGEGWVIEFEEGDTLVERRLAYAKIEELKCILSLSKGASK